jgi:hypothetical protein
LHPSLIALIHTGWHVELRSWSRMTFLGIALLLWLFV